MKDLSPGTRPRDTVLSGVAERVDSDLEGLPAEGELQGSKGDVSGAHFSPTHRVLSSGTYYVVSSVGNPSVETEGRLTPG